MIWITARQVMLHVLFACWAGRDTLVAWWGLNLGSVHSPLLSPFIAIKACGDPHSSVSTPDGVLPVISGHLWGFLILIFFLKCLSM